MKTVKQYIKNPKFGTGDEPEFIPVGNTGIDAVKNRLLQVERQELNLTIKNSKNYSTLTEAIADVTDDKYKFRGFVLTFSNGSEWKSYIYNGQDSSGFSDERNWEKYSLGGSSSGTDIEITEEEPVSGNDAAVVYQIEDVPDEEIVEYVTEAPADDSEYVRKNKGWVKSSGGGSSAEITKESVESVLTGNIESHTHDTVYAPAETDVWDGVTVSESLLGTGTKEDPYQINSCADWVHYIRNGNVYKGSGMSSNNDYKYVSVNKNLDFNNHQIDRSEEMLIYLTTDFTEYTQNNGCISNIIKGNKNTFKNINVLNGNICPYGAFLIVNELSIKGTCEYDLNYIDNSLTGIDMSTGFLFATLFSTPIIALSTGMMYFVSVFYNINSDITIKIRYQQELTNLPYGVYISTTLITVDSSSTFSNTSNILNIKCNNNYDLSEVIDNSNLTIYDIGGVLLSQRQGEINEVVFLTTTKQYNLDANDDMLAPLDKSKPIIIPFGITNINSSSSDITLTNSYCLETGIPFIDVDSNKTKLSKPVSESELKDPSFLNTLNSASGENIWITGEDGFPTLNMQQKGAIQYDGYVKQSEFNEFKNQVLPSKNTYLLPEALLNPSQYTMQEMLDTLGGEEGVNNIINAIENGYDISFDLSESTLASASVSKAKCEILLFATLKIAKVDYSAVTAYGCVSRSVMFWYSNPDLYLHQSELKYEEITWKS